MLLMHRLNAFDSLLCVAGQVGGNLLRDICLQHAAQIFYQAIARVAIRRKQWFSMPRLF